MSVGSWELALLAVLYAATVFGAIARKAGFSRWLGLLVLVPLVNVVVIWAFAFAKWPAAKES